MKETCLRYIMSVYFRFYILTYIIVVFIIIMLLIMFIEIAFFSEPLCHRDP